jgi:hypothetical protein
MNAAADLIVYSPDRVPQLAVEAKRKPHPSSEWAAKMRYNLLADSSIPATRYFLLAVPERMYFWKDAPPQQEVAPDFEADTASVLRGYFDPSRIPPDMMSEQGLQLAVTAWLGDLTAGLTFATAGAGQAWLKDSGLLDAIRRGFVDTEVAA